MFVAVLSLGALGCKKKTAEGGDCAKAIGNSMALSKSDMEKMPGMDAKMLQKMTDVGIQRCKEDKWPADAIKCMTAAKTMGEAQACYGKLTQDQQDKMNKAAVEMVMGPKGGDRAGSGGAGSAGSGGGADGSGSAAAGPAGSGSSGSPAAPEAGSGSAGSAAAPK